MSLETEFFTDPAAFARLDKEWQTLLPSSTTNTLFLTPLWQRVWWEVFHPGDLCLITVRDEDRLVGVAPLYCETVGGIRRLSVVGAEWSDYLDWIISRENAPAILAALLDALSDPRVPAWDEFVMTDVPPRSPWFAAQEAAAARGLALDLTPLILSLSLPLPPSWDTYIQSLDKKNRHEIRRKFRKIEQVESRWLTLDRADELTRGVDDFIALHRASSRDKDGFWTDDLVRFFHSVARELLACGWLSLNFLEIEGERAASAFTFDYANQILVYNSGYDAERFGEYSPGVILFGSSIRAAIQSGREVYDFLRGNEAYKYHFGAAEKQLYKVSVTRK